MTYVEKISGPPGTGKTTEILDKIQNLMDQGIEPEQIAYLSLTNKAINEAKERIEARFGKEIAQRCKNFRTIHSFVTVNGGAANSTVMELEDWNEGLLQALKSYNFLKAVQGIAAKNQAEGRIELTQWQLEAGFYHKTIETTMEEGIKRWIDQKGWDYQHSSNEYIQKIMMIVECWMKVNSKVSFEDVVEAFNEEGYQLCQRFHTVFVDEAQDLTPNLWTTIERLKDKTENMLIFGDINQCIYEFAGVDPQRYIDFPCNHRRTLNKTYRFTQSIMDQAMKAIKNHNLDPEAVYECNYKSESFVFFRPDHSIIRNAIEEAVKQGKTVGFLATKKKYLNSKFMPGFEYTWNEETKHLVKASTVHKAKGGQFDIVIYLADMTGWTTAEAARIDYVAKTRAKEVHINL